MARVVAIGQPVNEMERRAIAYLRDHLPESYVLLHNFELQQGSELFEVDLALITSHAVYLIDVKGTHGTVEVIGNQWHPDGRSPYFSPLAKLRQLAKILKSLIVDTFPARHELRGIHVHAAVLLAAPDAKIADPSGRDGPDVPSLNTATAYFASKAHVPPSRQADIRPYVSLIEQAIRGKAQPRTAPLIYRDWQIEERLGGDSHYTEYRAKHTFLGKPAGMARLRVYRVDPYLEPAERVAERKRISHAFEALNAMPGHQNILAVKEFFATEDADSFVLVTEDIVGRALRQHIRKVDLALTFDQKLRVVRGTLAGLEHAHRYGVIHRNLTPDAILVGAAGRACLSSFDYARVATGGASTIAPAIVDDLDPRYQSPECYREPSRATNASDLFSAGIVFYELLTGELPFQTPEEMFERSAMFAVPPSVARPDLPAGLDSWLQTCCAFSPEERFGSTREAFMALRRAITPTSSDRETPTKEQAATDIAPHSPTQDLNNLEQGTYLAERFIVQERLGRGRFGVAYKVFDSFGEVTRVIKLVTHDRLSVRDRLRQEYRTLLQLPPHRYVVTVIWADLLQGQTPYLVFEYVEGLAVDELLKAQALSWDDTRGLITQAAEGLAHLHRHGVYHQDIKPSNLLWTDQGVRIIDFNVAASAQVDVATPGGTPRYLPPDFDSGDEPSIEERTDRDIYALALTFYECLTGESPFDPTMPRSTQSPKDPSTVVGCEQVHDSVVALLHKALAPTRPDRFPSVPAFLAALRSLPAMYAPTPETPQPITAVSAPNTNPFVSYLLTLYSQSRQSNAGTRGLDILGTDLYIPTQLDDQLKPALLSREIRLAVISGNAGDGKTAFIQHLERDMERQGTEVVRGFNGSSFIYQGHRFLSNYDGSQDEGERINEDILSDFLAPYAGTTAEGWPELETRLLAINEGRLVDFLNAHRERFLYLAGLVEEGLRGADPVAGVAIINLNLRSVVADTNGPNSSIFDRLLRRFVLPEHWAACNQCDLRDRCFVHHNARTFIDPTAAPKVIERLKTLYTITHLRAQLHITVRDLRSALSFMLVGTCDCAEIHRLYADGGDAARALIEDGYYFNSWLGGSRGSQDRLIGLLREIDIAEMSNPELDREYAYQNPDTTVASRFQFSGRGSYDQLLLVQMFRALPHEGDAADRTYFSKHWRYVGITRRRQYFEARGNEWKRMLPYHSYTRFLTLLRENTPSRETVDMFLQALNRGEGLADPGALGRSLALRVRQVERGSISSYRLFPADSFSLKPPAEHQLRFVEYLSQVVVLRYERPDGSTTTLPINLDLHEMLSQLEDGYQPTLEELEGQYLALVVFKNVLSSEPYQEVMLTETGSRFFRIRRDSSGVLTLESAEEVAHGA